MFRFGELHQIIAGPALLRNKWMDQGNYHFLDVTAGNGWIAGTDSALSYDVRLLEAAARRFDTKLRAHLIEVDEANASQLVQHCSPYQADIHCGDHVSVLMELSATIGKNACGLLLFDPNPGKANLDSADAIGRFCLGHQRIDVLCFLSGTAFKRIKADAAPTVRHVWSRMQKRHWRIGPVDGRNQYVILLGSNWGEFPTWHREGFVDVNSREGLARVENLTTTEAEAKKKQLNLPIETTRSICAIHASAPSGQS